MIKNRHLGIDLLRIIAALGVILIHVGAPYVTKNMTLANDAFWAGNLYDTLGRFSVPIFVTISGYFLLKPMDDWRQFYHKRFTRILWPFFSWSVVYLLWAIFFDRTRSTKIVDGLLWGKPYFHLWFLGMLMGLYAVAPLLGDMLKRVGRRNFTYVALGALLLGMGMESWNTYMHNKPWIGVWWVPYVGYFMLGPVVADFPKLLQRRWLLAAAILASYTMVFLFTGWLFEAKHYVWYFYDSLGICGIVATLSMFNLFRRLNLNNNRLVERWAALTFGIYLVHMIPLTVINRYFLGYLSGHVFLDIPIIVLATFFTSTGIIWLIEKVPMLKRVML